MNIGNFQEGVTGVMQEWFGDAYEEPFDVWRDTEEAEEEFTKGAIEASGGEESAIASIEALAAKLGEKFGLERLGPEADEGLDGWMGD